MELECQYTNHRTKLAIAYQTPIHSVSKSVGASGKPGLPQVQLGQGDQAFIHKVQVGRSVFAAKICRLDTPLETMHGEFEIIAKLTRLKLLQYTRHCWWGFLWIFVNKEIFIHL